MDNNSSVVLVSAFGRGHWLAANLVAEGIPVDLIDVTERMGVWPVEDTEGPFGFFKNEKVQEVLCLRFWQICISFLRGTSCG